MYSFFKYQDKVSKTLEVEGVDYEQHSLVFGVWCLVFGVWCLGAY
ncbi:MAG: hypothetical protein ACJAXS_000332 [Colwellia sp.]|jgi:hypothetical protein